MTLACSLSPRAPNRAVLTLTHEGSSAVFAATEWSRDSHVPSMPFAISIVGATRPRSGANRFFQPGSPESSAGDERIARSGFGRSSRR